MDERVKVEPAGAERLPPLFELEMLRPAVEPAPLFERLLEDIAEPRIPPRKDSFQHRSVYLVPLVRDGRLEVVLEPVLLQPEVFLRRDMLPLEWRERLGDEGRGGDADAELLHSLLLADGGDLLRHRRYRPDIFFRLGRKAEHEVELEGRPAVGEERLRSLADLVLRYLLVDDVPEPLATRLGCDGESHLLFPAE